MGRGEMEKEIRKNRQGDINLRLADTHADIQHTVQAHTVAHKRRRGKDRNANVREEDRSRACRCTRLRADHFQEGGGWGAAAA